MDTFATQLMDLIPVLIASGGLLWSFSKQITKIEAELIHLRHQIDDCKVAIESNRQGRIEVFGVINGTLKPKDDALNERLARVETKLDTGIAPGEVYTRLAKIEAELGARSVK